MGYDFDDKDLYRSYNQGEGITLEELHEMVLNMKFETRDLYDGAITTPKIADYAVDSAKIGNAVIGEAHIQEASINKAMIQDLAVTRAKIALAAIGSAQIEDASIGTAQIGDAVIDTAHIKEGSITTALIGDAVIGSTQIAEGSITDAHIVSLVAGKIVSGTIDTGQVTVAGENGKLLIKNNRLQVFDNQTVPVERVSLGDVNDDGTVYGFRVRGVDGTTVLYDEQGVYNEGITDGAITNPKIGSGEIENKHIVADTITGNKLVVNAITAREIKAKTITANEIDVATIMVGSANIIEGSIGTAQIADASITSAKVQRLSADKIIVGADSQFADGYDPTKIEIGGRNLMSVEGFQVVNHLLANISNRGEMIDNKTFKIYANPPNGSAFLFKESKVEQGQEYILNADMSDTISSIVGVTVYDRDGNILEEEGLISGDFNWVSSYRGYQLHSNEALVPPYRFKIEDERVGYVRARLGIYRGNFVTRDVFIRKPKLEKGNKATDWSSAEEDNPALLWQFEDTTEIDGGSIRTNTITANQIATNAITADKVKAGELTADHLNITSLSAITANLGNMTAGNITGVNINGATITQQSTDGGSIKLDNEGFILFDQQGKPRINMLTRPGQGLHGDGVGIIFTNEIDGSPDLVITHYYTDSHISSRGTLKLESSDFGVEIRTKNAIDSALRVYGKVRLVGGDLLIDRNGLFGSETGYTVVRSQNDRVLLQSDVEVRAVKVNSTSTYTDFRANNIFGEGRLVVQSVYDVTTGSGANVYVATNGYMARSSSGKQYKQDIKLAGVDPHKLRLIKPKKWFDKGEISRNGGTTEGLKHYYGAVANDFESVGLPEYVVYHDETGDVENFNDRAWLLLIPLVNELYDRIDVLEQKLGSVS